jgi:transposase
MKYIGMDVHSVSTTFCIFDPNAPSRQQYQTLTRPTTRPELEAVLQPFAGECAVVYEVGPQAQWLAAIIRPLAKTMVVANPSRMPWLFRDGRKNDQIDARKLVTLLYLQQVPTVHLPSADVSAWRALINNRRTIVKRRTMVKNQIRGLLRAYALRCPEKSCWTHRGRRWLETLDIDPARNFLMRQLLDEVDYHNTQLKRIEQELTRIGAQHPAVALLRSIPGVGPRTAEAIVAFADDVRRFGNRKQFASYFGMVPKLDASGGRERLGHITKRGPSVVRWLLGESTHIVIRRNPQLRAFFDQVQRGDKQRTRKAIIATARKLLSIAFAMMREGRPYDPERVRAA